MTDTFVELKEMRESIKIILQCIDKLPKGPVKSIDGKISPPNRDDLNNLWKL